MNQPLAYIHPNARIAEDVKIEAFAWIGEDVEIGSGTWIGPNAVIMDGARIGKNCKIFPGAVISAIPQDLKYKGETTYCYIGDGTTVRESATVNKGTVASGKTVVGKDCLLMAFTHVAHDCFLGQRGHLGGPYHCRRLGYIRRTCCSKPVLPYWCPCDDLRRRLGQQGHSSFREDRSRLPSVLCGCQFHRPDAPRFLA